MIKELKTMFTEKYKIQYMNGIKQLERVGVYLVIANRWFYETGEASRYGLVNGAELWLHIIQGSQYAAVVFAQKHGQ